MRQFIIRHYSTYTTGVLRLELCELNTNKVVSMTLNIPEIGITLEELQAQVEQEVKKLEHPIKRIELIETLYVNKTPILIDID